MLDFERLETKHPLAEYQAHANFFGCRREHHGACFQQESKVKDTFLGLKDVMLCFGRPPGFSSRVTSIQTSEL